jgi:hypothetical protein
VMAMAAMGQVLLLPLLLECNKLARRREGSARLITL